ncbi:uncharacterized protein PHALS_00090 [Plasmopara halstedii]|uniref:PH domain-containing protein n=1 Tax=Plasmopara halstedii TaxID=4781 RepID=A0A0P1A6Q7_PLAHL|nr:uncharacterized protein PHALS_00090 [Plasmopara halstedii]CEG35756.1 hypothetical protein PHALS_00090 [Plasmopara halstedii]|eukprot:XP_024572125.1 hypothetical protein PHALS_00090 [Plasmopara halstedii]
MLSPCASMLQLTRQCTCAADTESDSDNDSDTSNSSVFSSGRNTTASASETKANLTNDANLVFSNPWTTSVSLNELAQNMQDPLKSSQALHNVEALRQASSLDNLFCKCYDIDTVLTTVQKRERGQFSPLQKLLLEPESIRQVFTYATSSSAGLSKNGSNAEPSNKYRRAYVATEIILKFYLKAMAWYGEPKRDHNGAQHCDSEPISKLEQSRFDTKGLALKIPPTNLPTMTNFCSNASTRKVARIQRLRAGLRFESSDSSLSDFSSNEDDDDQMSEDPATRGYLLRLEDLTSEEWKSIFGGLFDFLWQKAKSDGQQDSEHQDLDVEVQIDEVLVVNMCRIVKTFVAFPAVHKLLCDESECENKGLVLRLILHAYNPDIASLLHGLIHLCVRRNFPISQIIRCLVEQIVENVPIRLARSSSSVSSTSTVSSTSSTSPRSSFGELSTESPSAAFFSKPAIPSLFTSSTWSIAHARISGCAEILTKILKDEYPNTFRYLDHSKVQLASFESVKAFENELFPPKKAHIDPMMHHKLKYAVMTALTENSTKLTRLAELGVAELRFLDVHRVDMACIPQVLVIDILSHALEVSRYNAELLDAFVVPVDLILGTICTLINYHQHLSTISEFAARDCFSDSDSDVESSEIIEDSDFAINKQRPTESLKRFASRSSLSMRFFSPALSFSPTSGKATVNYRPLSSTLLVVHVVDLLDAVILMAKDVFDYRLSRLDLATSLLDIFDKFPSASILHCRLVKLYLNLLNRPSTNGHVNNPLLRSVFRSPNSILEFMLRKLDINSTSHTYDAHLAIIGVKIAKICSSPTLQQELICQFCNNIKGWNDFAAALVATHHQQMDALGDSLLGLQLGNGKTRKGISRTRFTDDDNIDTEVVLARASSSASEYLSRDLEPFRRLPMESEGIGSSQNLARGSEVVHPSDMFQSRSQSKYPKSILDILQAEQLNSFDIDEDHAFIAGYAYQKRSKWVKVHLKFEKSTCHLTVQDAATQTSRPLKIGASKAMTPSILKQFLMTHTQVWTSRPKTLVVCNARNWIAFGRSVKRPDRGAFGFQVEVFDGHREEDETLTFVTCSKANQIKWFDTMQNAVNRTRTSRSSFSQIDVAANTTLVECVSKCRGGPYSVIPDVNLLSPVTSASFFLRSEVPEEMPFWGTYHGELGIVKYVTLFKQCLRVVSVKEKNIQAINYSVIVEFDATFQRADESVALDDVNPPSVACACTDTYLISGCEIIGLTRTIADSEKLMEILCNE